MAQSSLVSSAKVVCYINGKQVGTVTSFRFSSDTPHREIMGLDSAIPFELAPQTAHVSGTIGLIKTVGDGGAEGLGIVSQGLNSIRDMYFSLNLVDRVTGGSMFYADYCCVQGQSWDVPNKGLVAGNVNFAGITWANEAS